MVKSLKDGDVPKYISHMVHCLKFALTVNVSTKHSIFSVLFIMKTTLLILGITIPMIAHACWLTNLASTLMAGEWRSRQDVKSMSGDDQRNTLIVELNHITSESVPWLQGKKDGQLIEIASVAIFLRNAEIRTLDELAGMSADDQRNTLIVELNKATNETIPALQAKSSKDLADMACGLITYKLD